MAAAVYDKVARTGIALKKSSGRRKKLGKTRRRRRSLEFNIGRPEKLIENRFSLRKTKKKQPEVRTGQHGNSG